MTTMRRAARQQRFLNDNSINLTNFRAPPLAVRRRASARHRNAVGHAVPVLAEQPESGAALPDDCGRSGARRARAVCKLDLLISGRVRADEPTAAIVRCACVTPSFVHAYLSHACALLCSGETRRTLSGPHGTESPVRRTDERAADNRDAQLHDRAHRNAAVLSANEFAEGVQSLGR